LHAPLFEDVDFLKLLKRAEKSQRDILHFYVSVIRPVNCRLALQSDKWTNKPTGIHSPASSEAYLWQWQWTSTKCNEWAPVTCWTPRRTDQAVLRQFTATIQLFTPYVASKKKLSRCIQTTACQTLLGSYCTNRTIRKLDHYTHCIISNNDQTASVLILSV